MARDQYCGETAFILCRARGKAALPALIRLFFVEGLSSGEERDLQPSKSQTQQGQSYPPGASLCSALSVIAS